MGLKQITANPTVQAVAAVLLGALSVVGVSSVRGTLGVSADPTTRHGELAVRVDAGGADVTALAAVDPGTTGQVLTVGDAGIPVWRDPSSGGVTLAGTGAVAVYAGDAGTVDGAGAADASVLTLLNGVPQWAAPAGGGDTYPVEMLAGGLEGAWSALGASPAGATATITGGQVTITMAASSCDWTAAPCSTDAVRAVRSIPYYTMSDWSLRARLVSATSSANFVPMFGVTTSATTWSTSVAKYVLYFAGNSDTVTLMRVAGSGVAAGSTSIASIRGGQGWLRIDHLGGRYIAYGGVGSAGAEPTSWTLIGGVASTGTDPPPQRVVIGAHGSVVASIVWDSVRLQAVE